MVLRREIFALVFERALSRKFFLFRCGILTSIFAVFFQFFYLIFNENSLNCVKIEDLSCYIFCLLS